MGRATGLPPASAPLRMAAAEAAWDFVPLAPEDGLHELGAVHLQVGGNVSENGVQCADLEGLVLGHGHMVLAAGEVARQLQTAITSSLTRCSRITFGRLASSK